MLTFRRLVPATFVSRPNRYLIVAESNGELVEAACRDPGRLGWLLRPGLPLRLRPAAHALRRTAYDVMLARRGVWVSLVPALANRLFEDALSGGGLTGLRGARILRREPVHGRSRFDFLLSHRGRRVLAEIKSVGFVKQGHALFPDAPTARGTRHLQELTAHARAGGAALLVFVVQRSDAIAVSPHRGIDPDFADALAAARRAGVRVLGYAARVSPRGAGIVGSVPVVPR